ncbi:methyl-accepting chemotaxis protein [Eleftheria terrae]|uniref:methyl-accepting chemotaxis protein n=1 Tax=Eleftheria terrae TaxID=1597781 RepID=UPI00263A3DA6|nr:PAS domain-containing methyl-accepting chemotaxis protein [Eleftheria terrae]WKB54998.1 PAS domain-containing methyl-accepting chemotaxis protein [Eleftheria terrae]
MNAPYSPALDTLAAAQHSSGALWAAIDRSQVIVEFDMQGRILWANGNALQTLGHALDELTGRPHRVLCDEEFGRSEAYQRFWQKLGRGEFDAGEYRHLAKTGREVWLQATYNPVADENGGLAKVVMLGTDVTLNKQMLAEVRGKAAALDRAQAVVELNLAGNILSANERFLALTGYSLRELTGQHHGMLCPGAYLTTAAYAELWSRLAAGEAASGRYPCKGRHGEELWLQSSYSPVLDGEGKPLKVLMFAMDITAQVAQEAQARERSATVMAPVARLLGSLGEVAAAAQSAQTVVQASQAEAGKGGQWLDGSAQTMAQIEQASDGMGEIVRLVSEFASQTTLLSFTAALEAVRAGDQGQGFATVADELRQLADRATGAASQSSRLIIDSVRRIAPAVSAAKQASQAFARIAEGIASTDRAVSAIGQAAASQSQLAAQVSALMQELQAETDASSATAGTLAHTGA